MAGIGEEDEEADAALFCSAFELFSRLPRMFETIPLLMSMKGNGR